MKNTRCIWCQGPAGGHHVEHIVPEVIGCPPNFVLPAEIICLSCNNGLGHLDQAVADDFDFVSFQAGIPRKKGRPAGITGRGNVYGLRGANGPEIFFNMDPVPILASDGTHVAAYRGSERNIKANLEKGESCAQISFQVTFGQAKKFQRGIYKIALSALVYFIGPKELYKPKYDQLRQYVRKGSGTRHFIVLAETDSGDYHHKFVPPFVSPTGDYVLEFRLACVRFIVDLSESESYLPKIAEAANREVGEKGWTVVPI